MRIATFNALSQAMIGKVAHEHERWEHRKVLLTQAFDNLTQQGVDVVALQEIDRSMGADLEPAFTPNFQIIKAHYSPMLGTWLCVNKSTFRITNVIVEKIGSFIVPSGQVDLAVNVVRKPGHNVFNEAAHRDSEVIIAIIEDNKTKQRTCVATYHMPCAYWCQAVMLMHWNTLVSRVHLHSEGCPIVLSGDFNTKPSDPLYAYMTKGDLDLSLLPCPGFELDNHHPATDAGEDAPNRLTNWNGAFKACIDYVFTWAHTGTFRVVKYTETELRESGPCVTWGSDHAIVYVVLTHV